VYSEYLAAHAGYLRVRGAAEEEALGEVVSASSAAAAAWRAEKSRDGEPERELELARDRVLLFGVAAVLVQATEVAMETARDSDGEEAKPPCCQTPTR
jgi:hypothetical protein